MVTYGQSRGRAPILATVALGFGLAAIAAPSPAQANPWRRMRQHHAKRRCFMRLMHAPPDMLKNKLKLTDPQIAKIEPLRMNFLRKAIKYRAMIQEYGLDMRSEMRKDLPNQASVLRALRKIRGAHGNMAEEGVKAYLAILRQMNAEQRKGVRQQCRMMMRGMFGGHGGRRWQHRGWRGGRGKGQHGGGGWGGGRGPHGGGGRGPHGGGRGGGGGGGGWGGGGGGWGGGGGGGGGGGI